MKKQMVVYGVYKLERYPEWNFLVTGFGENKLGEWVDGFCFNPDDGSFVTSASLSLPLEFKNAGYIYSVPINFKLELKAI